MMNSKTCYVCSKRITEKNEIGLNKKLLGRTTTKFYCFDCLADYLEIGVNELTAKIEEFKMQGCALFV